jgi:hypothetical protein
MLKIKKTKKLVTITFDNRYKQICWPAGTCVLAEITPEEVIETIDIQEKYQGFPKLLSDLYTSGVSNKGILKDVASFIKREYSDNQINWQLVDEWLAINKLR